MQNHLTNFDFNNKSIRVVEIDGNPWFVAIDVTNALNITNMTNSTIKLHPTEIIRKKLVDGRGPSNKLISESGLYKLIMRSDKPEAKAFQDWVTSVVLPAIRKDGGYVAGEEKVATGEMTADELVLKAISVMQRKIERLASENVGLREELTKTTIAEYTALNHVYLTQSEKGRMAAKARILAEYLGKSITKQKRVVRIKDRTIHTEINVYPRELLDRVATDLGLFEAAHGEARPVC